MFNCDLCLYAVTDNCVVFAHVCLQMNFKYCSSILWMCCLLHILLNYDLVDPAYPHFHGDPLKSKGFTVSVERVTDNTKHQSGVE